MLLIFINYYFFIRTFLFSFLFDIFNFLFLVINLSKHASTAGNNTKIKIVEHNVPSEIVLHIFAAIADVKHAIIRVTIISIELEVNMVFIDLLYESIIDSFIPSLYLCSK